MACERDRAPNRAICVAYSSSSVFTLFWKVCSSPGVKVVGFLTFRQRAMKQCAALVRVPAEAMSLSPFVAMVSHSSSEKGVSLKGMESTRVSKSLPA